MKRRDFIKAAALPFFLPKISLAFPKNLPFFGWIPNEAKVLPSVYQRGNLEGFGEEKVAMLIRAYTSVRNKPWKPRFQEWGDCVAQASGAAVDVLTACQIFYFGREQKYVADSSTDMIYSGCRNLIGRKEIVGRMPSAGAYGGWAVEYLKQYGNLLRINYPPYDLRPYSKKTVRYWDREGIPDPLQKEAKKHPILDYAPVYSFKEVRDAVAAGHPIVFCGYIGAEDDQRDKDGFVKPRGRWPHAWLLAGVQDGKRPGALLVNSHGPNFGRGPKTYGQPDGSVWIDAEYIDQQVSKYRDSYALTLYKGFEAPEEDYVIW